MINEDLKVFIRLKSNGITAKMKKSGFPKYEASFDNTNGPSIFKSFIGNKEFGKMVLIFLDGNLVGASYAFTPVDHSHFLRSFEIFDWEKTVDEKMVMNVSLKRVDLWISEDKKRKVKIDFLKGFSGSKDVITNITLTTNVVEYDFE
jgi:hypothetical protein